MNEPNKPIENGDFWDETGVNLPENANEAYCQESGENPDKNLLDYWGENHSEQHQEDSFADAEILQTDSFGYLGLEDEELDNLFQEEDNNSDFLELDFSLEEDREMSLPQEDEFNLLALNNSLDLVEQTEEFLESENINLNSLENLLEEVQGGADANKRGDLGEEAINLTELEISLQESDPSNNLNTLEGFLEEVQADFSLDNPSGLDLTTAGNELLGLDNTDLELSDLESILDSSEISPSVQLQREKTDEDDADGFIFNNEMNPSARSNSDQFSQHSPQAKVFDQTMRVSVRKLDNINNMIGELVVKRNRLEEDQERLRLFLDNLFAHVQSLADVGARMHDLYERSLLEGALLASRQQDRATPVFSGANSSSQKDEELGALEMDRFTGFHLLSQEIIELIVRVREAASDIQFVVDESDKVTQSLRQVTTQLQEGINSSRMVPFGQTADRLPRAVRDISRKLKKQAELHVGGRDVLIDKVIVEHLYNPMTHLINNAIVHGIESPEERLRAGKPTVGQINIRAFIQGNQTVITVSDDGAGIDPETVKAKALEKNLITWAQAQNLSQQEVYDLLFHPGFSTKDKADDFAGRGVGMDVVSTDLKKIRGTVSIESEVGKGTTFSIRMPLMLSISKALVCTFSNTRIAFPIDGVEDTREYSLNEIKTNANGVKCISWQDKLLPFQPINNLLSYNRQLGRSSIYNSSKKEDDTVSLLILRSADNLLAVEVDEILAEQEIVIKQIEGPIPKPAGIAGATVLGDGTIMPIGDVLELIEIAQGKRTIEIGLNLWQSDSKSQTLQPEKTEPFVLVVDDSITVRELLSLSFNKLGYRVEQARDGQEAWDKLRGGLPCDMIFCDIEMPRMNGLELVSHLQQEEKLNQIPVAMLTSRGAEKHRKLAMDLGAKAYLTKPYTEKELMDVAQRLIDINKANRATNTDIFAPRKTLTGQENDRRTVSKTEPVVLIIDDSVTIRELLSMTFKKAGYRIEQARDGLEALEKLQAGLLCDLAFCDIEMPRMNGLELLSRLQEDERLASLPVAMLTSRGAQKMRNIAASRGAKGYFVKPYVEDALLDAAQRLIAGEVLIENINLDDLEDTNES
jgi:chemosensory pili system protein ChpA (sensor histidine kinase/response regulator)